MEDPRAASEFYVYTPPLQQQQQTWGIWGNSNNFSNALDVGSWNSQNQKLSPGEIQNDTAINSSQVEGSKEFSPIKKLIDRIQEDFPRTPSPIFGGIKDDKGIEIPHETKHRRNDSDQFDTLQVALSSLESLSLGSSGDVLLLFLFSFLFLFFFFFKLTQYYLLIVR